VAITLSTNPKFQDLVGQEFGRLRVTAYHGKLWIYLSEGQHALGRKNDRHHGRAGKHTGR